MKGGVGRKTRSNTSEASSSSYLAKEQRLYADITKGKRRYLLDEDEYQPTAVGAHAVSFSGEEAGYAPTAKGARTITTASETNASLRQRNSINTEGSARAAPLLEPSPEDKKGCGYYCRAFFKYIPFLLLLLFLGNGFCLAMATYFTHNIRDIINDWDKAAKEAAAGTNITSRDPSQELVFGSVVHAVYRYSASGLVCICIFFNFALIMLTIPWELYGCCPSRTTNWSGRKCCRYLIAIMPVTGLFLIFCVLVGALCCVSAVALCFLLQIVACSLNPGYAATTATVINEALPLTPSTLLLPATTDQTVWLASIPPVEPLFATLCSISEASLHQGSIRVGWALAAWVATVWTQSLIMVLAARQLHKIWLQEEPPQVRRRNKANQQDQMDDPTFSPVSTPITRV